MSRKPLEIYLESRNAQVFARAAQALREAGVGVHDRREPPTLFAVAAPDPRALALDLTRNTIHFVLLKTTPDAISACMLSALHYYRELEAPKPGAEIEGNERAPAAEAPVEAARVEEKPL